MEKKDIFTTAIIALIVGLGASVGTLTYSDVFSNELKGYYVCSATEQLSSVKFVRLASTLARGYPYLDSNTGYKDCKGGTWTDLTVYAASIGIDPYEMIQKTEVAASPVVQPMPVIAPIEYGQRVGNCVEIVSQVKGKVWGTSYLCS